VRGMEMPVFLATGGRLRTLAPLSLISTNEGIGAYGKVFASAFSVNG
jgi:hypothetical protein